MRSSLVILFFMSLVACSHAPTPTDAEGSPQASDNEQATPESLELTGSWEYTGGANGLTMSLTISDTEMQDAGDYQGTTWDIMFTIVSWDNDARQAVYEVAAIEGFSHYALGERLYSRWQLDGDVARMYYSKEDYPTPEGGVEGT